MQNFRIEIRVGNFQLYMHVTKANGDLIAIHDPDIATVFALEALSPVDHFDFLDRSSASANVKPGVLKSASKQQLAADAGWFLTTNDSWSTPYFDPNDLRLVDRQLFGNPA